MGDYLTYEKITRRIPAAELARLLDVADDGQLEVVANDIIADVEAELLSYVERRRDKPSPGEARMLEAIAFRRFRHRAAGDRRSVGEDAWKDFDADTKWLEAYVEGKRSLGDAGETARPGGGQQSAQTRVFDRDKLEGF